MISYEVDCNDAIKGIEEKLGALWYYSDTVLAKAINACAKEARGLLFEETQKSYAVRKLRFEKILKLRHASESRLSAILHASGKRTAEYDFEVSPMEVRNGTSRPSVVKARVRADSPLKAMTGSPERSKAFVVKFDSGHITLVQREIPERIRGRLKTLSSVSAPQMLGHTWGAVEPRIAEMLQKQARIQTEKFLAKGAKK